MGLLCPADFKVRPEARDVFKEVARFAAPADVGEIFKNVRLSAMLRSLEVNTVRVWFPLRHIFLYIVVLCYVVCRYRVRSIDTPFAVVFPRRA